MCFELVCNDPKVIRCGVGGGYVDSNNIVFLRLKTFLSEFIAFEWNVHNDKGVVRDITFGNDICLDWYMFEYVWDMFGHIYIHIYYSKDKYGGNCERQLVVMHQVLMVVFVWKI